MGRVPSGCASLTSAPRRMRARAALRFPCSMRVARESLGSSAARSDVAATIAETMPMRERFTAGLLNHIGIQLVMVRPQPLGRGIQKLVRIFPGARQSFQNAGLQHVLRTIAFAHRRE